MCILNLYLHLVGIILLRTVHLIQTEICETRHLSHTADFVHRQVFGHIDSGCGTIHTYFSKKVFDGSRPKIPAWKWSNLFVIGTGARCGSSEQRPVCLGRFRVFHRCDLLHFRKIFSVIHFYVRGGSTSCMYHESHNSGQYLHDTNFCPAAECTQWPSADETTWLTQYSPIW
jgi:hypothetical protein